MPNTLEILRSIIDEQNVEELQLFIKENQTINYDNICANGASALWWALMPPARKEINPDIVGLLLECRKNDGSNLVNPVQAFSGLTPSQYLNCAIAIRNTPLIRLVETAENRYTPQRSAPHEQNLAAIAADGQSAHDTTVSTLSRANIIRLHQYYVREKSSSLDVWLAGKEIDAYIDAILKDQSENADQMRYGLRFCYGYTKSFVFHLSEENDESFSLTLAQLVTLNWVAANEQDVALLPSGATDIDALESRKKAILNILYDIATAYGKNRASCAGGACNRLGMALASQHQLVQASSVHEKITGVVATLVFLRILGQTIEELSKDDKDWYWAVIRHLTLDDAHEDKQRYEAFIKSNRKLFLAKMYEENIDEDWAAGSIEALEYAYPLSNHKTSYQLTHLMDMMHKRAFDLTLFDGNTSVDETVYKAVDILAQRLLQKSPAFLHLKEKFAIQGNDTDLALEKNFILNWLELARRRQDGGDLHSFFKNNKNTAFSEECFLISFFLTEKETLKQENPAQAHWLDSLTHGHIFDLMSSIHESSSGGLGNTHDLTQQLTLKAMELGFTAHLPFENMHFIDKDLRAFDFSDATLTNVTFENCILPLAGSNIHCHNVTMKHCLLPGRNNDPLSKSVGHLFSRFCRNRNYIPSSLVTQFYLAQWLNPESMLDDPFSLLIFGNAVLYNHTEIVKQILASDKCSKELLEHFDAFGDTALIVAVTRGNSEIVKEILASDKCSKELLEHSDTFGDTALIVAVKRGNAEIVKEILASDKCSKELLEHADPSGNTVLALAIRSGNTEIVKEILASDKCSKELLEHADPSGNTTLGLAVRSGNAEIVKIFRTYFSYQTLWDSKESEEDKILAILDDYCKGTLPVLSQLSLFAHGHLNRHHINTVRNALKEYALDNKKSLSEMLEELKGLEKNDNGSLSRRLAFIESRYQTTRPVNPTSAELRVG